VADRGGNWQDEATCLENRRANQRTLTKLIRQHNVGLYNPTLAMQHYNRCLLGISRHRPREMGSELAIGKHFHSHRIVFQTVFSL
jgi:hypothetical protein